MSKYKPKAKAKAAQVEDPLAGSLATEKQEETLQLRVSSRLLAQLDTIKERTGARGRAAVIRHLVEEFCKKHSIEVE
ncbi:MAG: hypothetical protein RLZZ450_5427 [Pseudomonadota bacterium]